MQPLLGKIALVTGASGGIGAAVACRLAQDGASIVMAYHHGEKEASDIAHGIRVRGGHAEIVQTDLTAPYAVAILVQTTIETYGGWHVLVHCAGGFVHEPLVDLHEEHLDQLIAINLKVPFLLAHEASKKMADGGRIVFLSSGSTHSVMAGNAAYVATKAGVEMLSRTLAIELGSKNITVNAILPGVTDTRMISPDPNFRAQIVQRTPLKRLGLPTDIADAIAFLASDDARWITGTSLVVAGGLVV